MTNKSKSTAAKASMQSAADAEIQTALQSQTPFRAFWSAFCENRGALVGLSILAIIILAAIFADFIAPHSLSEQYRDSVRAQPVFAGGSWKFILGTDGVGRDTLSRLIYGARTSLFIALAVVVVSMFFGIALGLLAASTSVAVDVVISRVIESLMAFPSLVLAVLLVAVLGPGLFSTIIAVSIGYLPTYVRLMRACAKTELSKDYVTAAKVMGVGKFRLMVRTILPNCMAPLIVQAALGTSGALLEAAALGFLGFGVQPPTPEWGAMLADAREFIRSDPWIVTLPGLAILITVIAINLAGDGLRDALDPKLRRS
ncbi:MAG: ABC transporter permease subunit [Candidatus Pacebacteria bacterium]|nr:ABC transporter permease subunit [Candidatus Paceibacterota bacterium]